MTTKVSPLLPATGVDDPERVDGAGTRRPDPEVPERAKRRTFTAQYKLDDALQRALEHLRHLLAHGTPPYYSALLTTSR